jgi:hypothetical protein
VLKLLVGGDDDKPDRIVQSMEAWFGHLALRLVDSDIATIYRVARRAEGVDLNC